MWQGERGFIFDFGISGAGTYHLKIKGECGQQIEVYTSDCVIEGKKITNRNLYCWSLTDKMADKVQHDHLTLSESPMSSNRALPSVVSGLPRSQASRRNKLSLWK